MLKDVGIESLWKKVVEMDWRIIILLSFHAFFFFFQALSWWKCIDHNKSKAKFKDVYLIKATGWTVAEITPLGAAMGETFKGYLIGRHVEKSTVISSLLLYNTIHTFVTISMIIIGVIFLFTLIPVTIVTKVIILAVLGVLLFGLFMLVRQQHKGFITSIITLLMKFSFLKEKLEAKLPRAREVDEEMRHFWQNKKWDFILSYIFQMSAKVVEAFELWVIMQFLNYPISFLHASFLFIITAMIFIVGFFVPSQIGVVEGGMNRSFSLLGLNPVFGTLMAIFRRIRVVFWIGVGLLIILLKGAFRKAKRDAELATKNQA